MIEMKTYKKGEKICEEFQYELCMYEIMSGSASVYMKYGTPDERKLAEINDGYIGEISMMQSKCRNATVIANEDMEVRRIDIDDCADYFKENHDRLKKMILSLSRRQDAINKSYQIACEEMRDCLADDKKNTPFKRKFVRIMKEFGGQIKAEFE